MTDVQDPGSQGSESEGGLFDTYLQAVPEDAREYVTGYLKDAEKNVNSRLSEAADIQKQWGPYQEIESLQAYKPEELSQLLEWHQQVASSPEVFTDWLKAAAQENGLTLAEAEQALEDEGSPELTQQQIQQQAAQAIQPLEQRLNAFEEQQQVGAMEQQISSAFSTIEKDEKITLTDAQKEAIVDLGESHKGDDWIEVGFSRFKTLAGEAQASFVKGKAQVPGVPLATGAQEGAKAITSWAEAGEQAKERLHQALAS